MRGRGMSTARISPMVAAGPLVIITIRSDSSTASSTSWVTMTTVLCVRATIFNSSSCRRARVRASSAPKGSSISSTLGSMASARAMPTRCFMPPEISCGRLALAWLMPTNSSAATARAFCCAGRSRPPKTDSTASSTLSRQLSHGSSEWFWNTTARSGPGAAISRPSQISAPPVGCSSPAMRLSSVDLPQPEWPISVVNSPRCTSRFTPCSAWKRPLRVVNTISASWTWMKGFMASVLVEAEAFGEAQQRPLEQQPDNADDEDRNDDVGHVEVVPLVPDPEADAHAAGQHLGRDDHQPGRAHAQAHAGQHIGQHRGQQDAGDDLPLAELEHAGDVEVVLRHALHADRGVDHHRPDRADEDGPDRGRVGALEGQQADRQPGQRRHRLEQRDQRRHHAVREFEAADQEAQRDAHQRREAKAQADAAEGVQDVPADALVVRALAVERVGKQLHRGLPGGGGAREAARLLRGQGPQPDQQRQAEHGR
mmetsp:Transcript_11774/g.27604  ORF Transcript_11774/g.27604 Transcript_11774/m.27604 type:complete len:483 (+) Transcript_11774:738-2186(+)